jgi:hypothetical protein
LSATNRRDLLFWFAAAIRNNDLDKLRELTFRLSENQVGAGQARQDVTACWPYNGPNEIIVKNLIDRAGSLKGSRSDRPKILAVLPKHQKEGRVFRRTTDARRLEREDRFCSELLWPNWQGGVSEHSLSDQQRMTR